MSGGLLKYVTLLSAMLFVASLLLLLAALVLNPWDHSLSVTRDFHVGVRARGLDARLVCFNDKDYRPYTGSIIQLVDSQGNVYPPLLRETRVGDSCGVYYRYFRSKDAILWTLMISLWYPVALFAVLPTLCAVKSLRCRAHRSVTGRCAKCGYDLRGLPEPRCPECGAPFRQDAVQRSTDS